MYSIYFEKSLGYPIGLIKQSSDAVFLSFERESNLGSGHFTPLESRSGLGSLGAKPWGQRTVFFLCVCFFFLIDPGTFLGARWGGS